MVAGEFCHLLEIKLKPSSVAILNSDSENKIRNMEGGSEGGGGGRGGG